jgi:hypothetical protein
MFPREIIEHENTCKVAEYKYHKVHVVFHDDWSCDECLNDSKREICGHTAIQHPREMVPIRDTFIAIGTVPGALWLHNLLIQIQKVSVKYSMSVPVAGLVTGPGLTLHFIQNVSKRFP